LWHEQLSIKALITLFDKLGREFVVENIFKSSEAKKKIAIKEHDPDEVATVLRIYQI
jgi:hypothetical protein